MNQPELIGGRYQVRELLGRGGMAEVRKGTDSRLGRTVAIKRLRTDLASDATFQARFRREAQSSASLNHPSIVAVYDTGEETTPEGISQPYIVMEYVAGRTLRDILREGRKILPERALEITSDVLSALDYSHRAGIIHRDIKPGNVMLTPSGDVKVMDFGIARAVSDAQSTMTQTAAVVGTAQYLSPEQARGESVDSRSDVYSAGCLLYELLTGRPPFVGDSPVAVAYQHVREQPTPPSDHDTALPAAMDAIVLKSLAKRVEDRYQSAAAMRDDIEHYLAGRPVSVGAAPPILPTMTAVGAPPPEATALVPPVTGAPTAAPAAYDGERDRVPRGLIIGGILLLLALIAAAIWGLPKLFPGGPDQVQVPSLAGRTEQQARNALADAGLTIQDPTARAASETVPSGSVIDTDPAGGATVDSGSAVQLTISTGKPDVTIPNEIGKTFADAHAELTGPNYDFTVQEKTTQSDQPRGTVVRQDPQPSDQTFPASPKTIVTLLVSNGPKRVPDVVGMSESDAVKAIETRGFRADPFYTNDQTDQPYGTVVKQNYPPGQQQPAGTHISITVTHYAGPPTMNNDAAATTLGQPVKVDVLANDSASDPKVKFDKSSLQLIGPDGQPTTSVPVPGQGTWSVSGGKVVFTPEPAFTGATSPVTYEVTDSAGNVGQAQVTVTVSP